MKLLTNEQQGSNKNVKISSICKENSLKLEIIVIMQGNIKVLHIAYIIQYRASKKISLVSHNG